MSVSVYPGDSTNPWLGTCAWSMLGTEREEEGLYEELSLFSAFLIWYGSLFGLEIPFAYRLLIKAPKKCITYCGHECMHCCGL